jgi:hypothetical protein
MIKNWNLFSESVDEKSKIVELCKKYKIENYTINDDLSIDVDGDVDLSYLLPVDRGGLTKIPLKFNRVSGYFLCNNNKLKSLFGCPEWVGDDFSCSSNQLTSLEFCPSYVSGDFDCYNNNLTSLCYSNNLTTLEYLPKWIGGNIDCRYNKIWSFGGIPDSFRGYIICKGDPIEHIWKLFESSGDIEFLNDCDALREPETPDGLPIVVLERLNFFLETIGKPPVEKVDGYINI